MKAAVFYKKEDLRIEDIPVPEISDTEVLVKVHACGICGTDVHIFGGDEGAAATPPKTVLGHEFAGEIVKTGACVTDYSVGDRVCVDPNKLCNECFYCKSGTGHFCTHMTGIGTTVNGGFAQYCAVPVSQLYKFDSTLPYSHAAMTEPVACCLHGIDLTNISDSDTVVIIGGGMIGLIMLQLAANCGANTLIMIEPVEEKRDFALKLGADIAVDPIHCDVKAELKARGIDRVTKVIECVGRTQTMEQAIDIAGNKATVMLFGLTAPADTVSIKPFEIFKKELEIKASFINPYTQGRALDLIKKNKIDVSSMVHKIIPLSELPRALSDPEMRRAGKIIVDPQM